MIIVIDKNIPFVGRLFEPFFEVRYLSYQEITKTTVVDADVLLIRTRTLCDKELLENSSVKLIVSATIGTDHLDTYYLDSVNITWRNVPGCNATAVVQYVFAALSQFSNNTKQRLAGKTLGIIGVGNIGKKVAAIAKSLEMNVLCCDPLRQSSEDLSHFVDLQTIAKSSDIITIHTFYTQFGDFSTHHLIDQDFFTLCKPNVWFINTSRGEVIDELVLQKILSKNTIITQIALDVWEGEPQIIHHHLPHFVNIATPHIAGYSLRGKINASRQAVEQIATFYQLPLQFISPPLTTVEIEEDNRFHNNEEIVKQIILQTYPIEKDAQYFLQNITLAEKIRSEYQYRLSFEDFRVNLTTNNQQLLKQLTTLGFQTNG